MFLHWMVVGASAAGAIHKAMRTELRQTVTHKEAA
jgi:hypothetical protein